jgi:hypothetical protein
MLLLNEFLPDLLILIVFCTVFIVGIMLWRPRMWLHDFPPDIQAMVPPKTQDEKRLTTLLGTPFIIAFFVLPVVLMWNLKSTLGADFSFFHAWIYAYALFFGFNLWDLVVLDWIGTSLIDPQHPPFPGTEGAAGYRDYAFHFYGFLKGCVIGLVFATIVAGVVTVFA